ncbi:MAG: phosphoenolpyruvate synthase [Chloroflexi bacterium]|nr:phosphoenolpyruvate synthase [Chloroflexota bacterium]MYC01270.1 phosphoenolpyruvate synthase [Chloroflexota bacterium]
MTSDSQHIVWFAEVGRDDVPLVGGKGANLGELTQADIPVPPGFVVTTRAYREFINHSGLDHVLRRILHGLNVDDDDQLNATADAVQHAIEQAEMPATMQQEITAAYAELGEGPVAVRSSATAEDLAEASFAGQQATFLNIEGGVNVVEAVQRCWASLFEARAIFYREQAGWGHLDVDLAVPVQRMVQSESSGVMFTVDPITNDHNRVVIEAAFGLGEAVVGGLVSPDHYEVDKSVNQILERQIFTQDRRLVRSPDGRLDPEHGANVWQDLSESDGSMAKLSDEQIVDLTTIGKRIESHYRSPQDIEWGWADNQFYLLQTRPITTVAPPARTNGDNPAPTPADPPILDGSPASPGVASGRIRVILNARETSSIGEGDVLVAEMTTPDFVPAMKRAAAIITERGGRTCHAAIISRELGVPCVVGAAGAAKLAEGREVTVDGASGLIYDGVQNELLTWWHDREEELYAPIATETKLYVNLAEPEIADRVAERDVDGVGLLRAEFIIARLGEHPRNFINTGRQDEYVRRLSEGMRKIASAFDPRPVVYRATDFKTNEYANLTGGDIYEPDEENPMIGYRGAARYIREPDLFELELRALEHVREDHPNLHLMIPFVRTPDEMSQVVKQVDDYGLARNAGEPDGFQLWMMVEVPSNVLLLDEFIDCGIDGVSIGSNDLTQLTLGIDRDSERFADTFDERNPAVLRAIEHVITTAKRRGITVSVCGQGPSEHPDLAQRLVDWGITSISVTPDVIEQTRHLVANAEAQRQR